MVEKLCFGVDVGGTSIKLGLFTENAELLDKWEVKTRIEEKGKHILSDIADTIGNKIIEKNLDRNNIVGIGLCVPGPVKDDGTVVVCVNLGWGIFNVSEELSRLTGGLLVKSGNDAKVAALGEMWRGGGMGSKDLVLITLGTGVGGGVIHNGEIVTGSDGAAGEIGHMTITHGEEEVCNCGKSGCLEQYASATGIVRVAKRMMASESTKSILRENPITAKFVIDAAKSGDALAIDIMEKVGDYLGNALANVSNVVDPEVFVIGGGVSRAGKYIIDLIERHYVKYAFHASRKKNFAIAKLGNDAGIYGCAKLILDK